MVQALLSGVLAFSTLLASNAITEVKYSRNINLENSVVVSEEENENINESNAVTDWANSVFSQGEFFGGGFRMNREESSFSEYEQYGLAYDEEKGSWMYDGKLVALFYDRIECTHCGRDETKISHLNRSGEINVKTVRDETGTLLGLVEMTEEEYSQFKISEEEQKIQFHDRIDGIMKSVQEGIGKVRESIQFELPEGFELPEKILDVFSESTTTSWNFSSDLNGESI